MKRRIVICLLPILLTASLVAKVKAPIGLDDDIIKLKRTKNGKKRVTTKKTIKKATTKKTAKKNGATALRDKPARQSSGLKLPPTVIDIEDKNIMRLDRSRSRYRLIPEIDRKDLQNEYAPVRTRLTDSFFKRKKRSSKVKRTISSFEVTYGLYDALSAFLSTGQEFRNIFYQVAYIRSRDEGFDKDGGRVANSIRGNDDLQIDVGWTKNQFEASANFRFFEKMNGLQSNTNYTQSRRSGLSLFIKGSYIFSSVANMKFSLRGSKGRFVLDNPLSQVTLNNYTTDAALLFHFSWARRTHISVGLNFKYDDYNADFRQDSVQRDIGMRLEGGFSIGKLVTIKLGCGLNFVDFGKAQLTPLGRISFALAGSLTIYGEAGRELRYLDFRRMLVTSPYAIYSVAEQPQDGVKMGGGFRLRLPGRVVLSGSLFRWSYDTYYVSVLDPALLYYWDNVGNIDFFAGSLALRWSLSNNLNVKITYSHWIKDDEIAYLPDLRIRSMVEFKVPGAGTVISVWGDVEGSRNNGALDPYFLLSAGIRQPIVENFYAVFRVYNLLNADYIVRDGYKEPGITIHGGIHIKF